MALLGKVFLLIAAVGLLLGGVLAWDTYVIISEGKETMAEVTRIETQVRKSTSSSSNTTRTRIIHLEYAGPGGKTMKGLLGHRFSSQPQSRKAGDPPLQLRLNNRIVLPSFTSYVRGDQFEALFHPDNPYYATDKRDLWIFPALFGGVGLLFLILGVVCLVTPPPEDPLASS